MKAEISKDGFIHVIAETVTEAWALNAIYPLGKNSKEGKLENRLILDCSILMDDGKPDSTK